MSRDGVIKLDQSTVAGRYRQHVHVSERNEWRYRGWEFTGVMPLSFEAAGRVGNADHLTRGIERRRDPHAAPRFRRSSLCGLLYRVPDELPPRGGAPRDGEPRRALGVGFVGAGGHTYGSDEGVGYVGAGGWEYQCADPFKARRGGGESAYMAATEARGGGLDAALPLPAEPAANGHAQSYESWRAQALSDVSQRCLAT